MTLCVFAWLYVLAYDLTLCPNIWDPKSRGFWIFYFAIVWRMESSALLFVFTPYSLPHALRLLLYCIWTEIGDSLSLKSDCIPFEFLLANAIALRFSSWRFSFFLTCLFDWWVRWVRERLREMREEERLHVDEKYVPCAPQWNKHITGGWTWSGDVQGVMMNLESNPA